MYKRQKKKTGLLFGEGKGEFHFFNFLLKTEKFKFLETDWFIETDHASGASCEDVLDACIRRATHERTYDITLCFIDIDKLYSDFPKNHQKKRQELEARATKYDIEIIWQEMKHEDEIEIASNGKIKGKSSMKNKLQRHKDILLRSDFVKSIFNRFHNHA